MWHTHRRREDFLFTGGIILIANCPLDNLPQAQALRTRIPCLHYKASNEELAALFRKIASRGHRHGPYELSPADCLEVVQEILSRSRRLQWNLDLRLLVNAFQDRLQFMHGAAETDWRVLLDSRMQERTVVTDHPPSRAERKRREEDLAGRIAQLPREERLRVWVEQTGKSEPALYRRLNGQ